MNNTITLTSTEHQLLMQNIGTNNTHILLGGVHFKKIDNNTLRLEACNGKALYTLLKKELETSFVNEMDNKTIILPKIKKSDTISFNGKIEIKDKKDNVTYQEYTKLKGKFPNIDMFLPKRENDIKLKINTSLLPKNAYITLSIENINKTLKPIIIDSCIINDEKIENSIGCFMPMKI